MLCAESAAEADLEAGLELGIFLLAQPVPRRHYSDELEPGPPSLCLALGSLCRDQPLPPLCAGTEFLSKDPPWMTAPREQDQGSGERTGLASPDLQTMTMTSVRVTLLGQITGVAACVFHEDCGVEQSFMSHPCSCSE